MKKKAFALVELLIVLVILAVIMAISVTIGIAVYERALASKIVSDIENIEKAVYFYHLDFPKKDILDINTLDIEGYLNLQQLSIINGYSLISDGLNSCGTVTALDNISQNIIKQLLIMIPRRWDFDKTNMMISFKF